MKHSIVAAAVLATLVAGCTTPVDTPEEPGTPEVALAWGWGEPALVAPNPNNQAEAAVTVSPDGQVILTCFHGFFTETSPGYASTDGGTSWKRMAFPDEAGIGGDCETAITDSGAWVFLASTVAGATVLVSQDNGTTWTVNHLAAIPTNGLADRPWITAVGDELWLTYMPLRFQPGTIGFTKSTDLGRSWSTPTYVDALEPMRGSVHHGHPVVIDGTVHLPALRGQALVQPGVTGAAGSLRVYTTTDGGATWTHEEVYAGPEASPDWPSLAVTEAGDMIVLATGPTHANLYVRSADGWSEPQRIEDPAGVFWPWIDGGHGHNATMVLCCGEHEGATHVFLGRVDAREMSVEVWPMGDRPRIEFGSVDHDAEGNAYAVWIDADGQRFVKGGLMPALA